jgi:hypothetical protein
VEDIERERVNCRSWLEFGDNFHPQIKELNAVLEGYSDKMKAAGFVELERSAKCETEMSKAEVFCGH